MIDMYCPSCGHHLSIDERHVGQVGACKHCRSAFTVPEKGDIPPASLLGLAPFKEVPVDPETVPRPEPAPAEAEAPAETDWQPAAGALAETEWKPDIDLPNLDDLSLDSSDIAGGLAETALMDEALPDLFRNIESSETSAFGAAPPPAANARGGSKRSIFILLILVAAIAGAMLLILSFGGNAVEP